MNLRLLRKTFTDTSTIGALSIDGKPESLPTLDWFLHCARVYLQPGRRRSGVART